MREMKVCVGGAILLALALASPGVVPAAAGDRRAAPAVHLAEGPGGSGPIAGLRAPERRRIIGGGPIPVGEAPWQVAVDIAPGWADGNAHRRQICGGSLVAPALVITAAHCVADERGRFRSPAERFSVVSGRTVLSSGSGVETGVSEYYYFVDGSDRPVYNPRSSAWDVVLLELSGPAAGTPIKLAGPSEVDAWEVGRAAQVSGWGSTKGPKGPYPDGLRAASVVVLPDSQCSDYFGRLARTSFCAGTALGTEGTCFGDSGGPIAVPVSGGEMRLVGDTSYGTAGRCGTYIPSAYGKLAAEPMRSSLQAAALEIAGTDIVGSGGVPPASMTPAQARENAWIYVIDDCRRWRPCRAVTARPCRRAGGGYRCKVIEYARKRRSRIRCGRRVSVSASSTAVVRRGIGKWRCRRSR